MGKINILKAGYSGKTGQTYGIEKKDGFIVKAIPFSHTPHNNKQVKAKDKFIGLNRIASAVVKKFWYYLGLSDKNMYRNNALCKLWKDSLIGDSFKLENLKSVISQNEELRLVTELFNADAMKFIYSAQDLLPGAGVKEQYIYLAIVTDNNITKADVAAKGNSVVLSTTFDTVNFAYFQVWAFKSVRELKKWNLRGLSISEPIFIIIVDEVFYVDRWSWHVMPYIENEVLYLSQEDAKIEEEILKIGNFA